MIQGPRTDQELVDEAAAESFPASDPPAWTPTHAGMPSRRAPAPVAGYELRARLRAHVERLAGDIGERNDQTSAAHARLRDAADYVAGAFADAGHAVTRYPFGAPEVENIEVEIPAFGGTGEIVIVGAHYDSPARSPGADDNASGVAVLLALADTLADRQFSRAVRLVAFANEERPHTHRPTMGSRVYADRLARIAPARAVTMLSLESLGVFGPPPRDFLALVANPGSRRLMRQVLRAFRAATDLPVRGVTLPSFLPLVGASDHASFWRYKARAVMITDTGPLRYPHYHEPTDTPDRLDYDRMAEVVPGIAAAIAHMADAI